MSKFKIPTYNMPICGKKVIVLTIFSRRLVAPSKTPARYDRPFRKICTIGLVKRSNM